MVASLAVVLLGLGGLPATWPTSVEASSPATGGFSDSPLPLAGDEEDWSRLDQLLLSVPLLNSATFNGTVQPGDIRLTNEGFGLTFGSQAQANDGAAWEVAQTASFMANLCFVDIDSSGAYNSDDPVYIAPTTCTSIPTSAIRLTYAFGRPAGSKVTERDTDHGMPAIAIPRGDALWNWVDANPDFQFGFGDHMYLDIGPSGTVTPGDIRISKVGSFPPGSFVRPSDSDVGTVLNGVGGGWAVGHTEIFVDTDMGGWQSVPLAEPIRVTLDPRWTGTDLVELVYSWTAARTFAVIDIQITLSEGLTIYDGSPRRLVTPDENEGVSSLVVQTVGSGPFYASARAEATLDPSTIAGKDPRLETLVSYDSHSFYFTPEGLFMKGSPPQQPAMPLVPAIPVPDPEILTQASEQADAESGADSSTSQAVAGCSFKFLLTTPPSGGVGENQYPPKDFKTRGSNPRSPSNVNLAPPLGYVKVEAKQIQGSKVMVGVTDEQGLVRFDWGDTCEAIRFVVVSGYTQDIAAGQSSTNQNLKDKVVVKSKHGWVYAISSNVLRPVAGEVYSFEWAGTPSRNLDALYGVSRIVNYYVNVVKARGFNTDHPAGTTYPLFKLNIIWDPNEDEGSYWQFTGSEIHLDDKAILDEFTLWHEYAHYLQDALVYQACPYPLTPNKKESHKHGCFANHSPDHDYGSAYSANPDSGKVIQCKDDSCHYWHSVQNNMNGAFGEAFAHLAFGVGAVELLGIPAQEVHIDENRFSDPGAKGREEWDANFASFQAMTYNPLVLGPYREGAVIGLLWSLYQESYGVSDTFKGMVGAVRTKNPGSVYEFYTAYQAQEQFTPTSTVVAKADGLGIPLEGDGKGKGEAGDTSSTATHMPATTARNPGVLSYQCIPCNDPDPTDYYTRKLPANSAVQVEMQTMKGQGLKLRVFNAAGTQVAEASTTSGPSGVGYQKVTTPTFVTAATQQDYRFQVNEPVVGQGYYDLKLSITEAQAPTGAAWTSVPGSARPGSQVAVQWTTAGTGDVLDSWVEATFGGAKENVYPSQRSSRATAPITAQFRAPTESGSLVLKGCAKFTSTTLCTTPSTVTVANVDISGVTFTSYPTSAVEGRRVEVCWAVTLTGSLDNTNVYYGTSPGHYFGTFGRYESGSSPFCASVTAPSASKLYMKAHAETSQEERFSAEIMIPISGSITSATIVSAPSQAYAGQGFEVCWDVAGSGRLQSTGLETSMLGQQRQFAGNGGSLNAPGTFCAYPVGSQPGTLEMKATASNGVTTVYSTPVMVQIVEAPPYAVSWVSVPATLRAGEEGEACFRIDGTPGQSEYYLGEMIVKKNVNGQTTYTHRQPNYYYVEGPAQVCATLWYSGASGDIEYVEIQASAGLTSGAASGRTPKVRVYIE